MIKCKVDLTKRIHRLYSRDISEIPLDSSTAPSGEKSHPGEVAETGLTRNPYDGLRTSSR